MFQDLNPLDRSTAIMEIIIMLLVAFILGFILAWILKRSRSSATNESSNLSEKERQLAQATAEKKEQLQSQLSKVEAQLQQAKDQIKQADAKRQQTATDSDGLTEKVAQLEKALNACEDDRKQEQKQYAEQQADCETKINALQAKLSETETTLSEIKDSDAENAAKLGFVAVAADRKDDLTRISGIGPFIEKKLNGLGIYTFEQISGFTSETVAKVTEAIEFFPGRIERDNWISQAKDLK
ncbi:MAG: hypothetical protein AAFO69_17940 [Bacteroidota bacterium]